MHRLHYSTLRILDCDVMLFIFLRPLEAIANIEEGVLSSLQGVAGEYLKFNDNT